MINKKVKIFVVIPCYKVKKQIFEVLRKIPSYVDRIIIIDDACPEKTGFFVQNKNKDKRVIVLFNKFNLGVGGAVLRGYDYSLNNNADVIVKIDGDGQMDPVLIDRFVNPIIDSMADYTKGNRFFNIDSIFLMPKIRIFGNAILSLLSKISTGYWNLFDPTNGYTAIHVKVLKLIPLNKISKNYFFESDLLFRLNIARAVVSDIPMDPLYKDEVSNLRIKNILIPFIFCHIKNFCKRFFYNYYLRGMTVASFELPIGLVLFIYGFSSGIYNWINSNTLGIQSPYGTIMVTFVSLIVGLQLILSFLSSDISSIPDTPIQKIIK